jgi:hypothetical protein
MNTVSSTTLRVVFQPPPRTSPPRPATRHERRIEGVPIDVARQVREDYVAYSKTPGQAERCKLYTFRRRRPEKSDAAGGGIDDGPRTLALDFGEITAVTAVPQSS